MKGPIRLKLLPGILLVLVPCVLLLSTHHAAVRMQVSRTLKIVFSPCIVPVQIP